MNKRNTAKVLSTIVKIAALVMAGSNLPELQAVLGENGTLAALLFGGASASKDVLVIILDYLDDVIVLALRVHASGYLQAYKLHLGGFFPAIRKEEGF